MTPAPRTRPPFRALFAAVLLALAAGETPLAAAALDLDEAQAKFRAGRYDEALAAAADTIKGGTWIEGWYLLKARCELARGAYPQALATLEDGLRRAIIGPETLLLGREVYRYNGRDREGDALLARAEDLLRDAPGRIASPEGRVALGRLLLARGADAKVVLASCFDAAIRARPGYVEAHLAAAELALAKEDYALAAETIEKAPKAALEDPRAHVLLARAFREDDRARSEEALAAALKLDPEHPDALLVLADCRIDDEKYDEAATLLARALAVNPHDPRALALRAVLAHLRNDPEGEANARASALAHWKTNPEVDSTIGRKLSQKYRFAEGSESQKKALALDPSYLPAKLALCQDLLRLGDEEAGWKLADEVFAADGYNVLAYNLVTLRDDLAKFETLKGDGLVVRMDPREAALYGRRVMGLLARAKATLAAKYGATLAEPVVVEIFPRKKEFAVRTFGLPGAEGFLGVCFGRVVTAISPAAQGETPSNWEAVLWHEFCHVVTLHASANRMPRWLSEGISVYEEGLANRSWRGALAPKYREMILGDDLVPLSRLSSAFLDAKSALHVQFAYQESALAVEYLVKKAGHEALRGLLADLGKGMDLNAALAARTRTSIDRLDAEFADFARTRARETAPNATFEEPDLPPDAGADALAAWLARNPRSFPGWKRLAATLVREKRWEDAKAAIAKLRDAYPGYKGADGAPALLAAVCRATGDAAGERKALEEQATLDGDAVGAYLRLMELAEAAGDWEAVARDADRSLAVNPLLAEPFRRLGRAAERLGRPGEALDAYRALALLDDSDPAETHYRLARLLKATNRPDEARREVLKALDEAPRFRDAHRLLLELTGDAPPPAPDATRPAGDTP
jgi:tetratricopeptide (TPR) repeat protein